MENSESVPFDSPVLPLRDVQISASLSTVAAEAFEHRFVEVIRELASEPQLEAFRNEYEKVHRLLLKSVEGEKRLIGKIEELRGELSSHGSKIETAVQLSQEDESTISTLRMEIEKAWAMADTAHQREKESREKIQVLKEQVRELDALVSQSAGLTMGQEAYLRDLISSKRQLEDEHSILTTRFLHLSEEQKEYMKHHHKLQVEEIEVREDYNKRLAAYQSILLDLEALQKERITVEQSLREYRSTTEKNVVEIEKKRAQIEPFSQEEARLKKEAMEVSETVQTLNRQVEDFQHRFKLEAARLSSAEEKIAVLTSEVPKKQAILKERKKELEKEVRILKRAEEQGKRQQGELADLVKERDNLIVEGNKISAESDSAVEIATQKEKELQALEGDFHKSMIQKTAAIQENATKEDERSILDGERLLEEGQRCSAVQELSALLVENEKTRKHLFLSEQLHQKSLTEAQKLTLEYHKTLDHIRAKRSDAKKLRELYASHEKKQKLQQELLERVNLDRSRTEKQLRETEADLRELKETHKSKSSDIERMKMELIEKESMLCQLHTVSKQIHRDTACTEQRASHLKEDCLHAQTRIQALGDELNQLSTVVASCDAEKLRQDMRLRAITTERNVLATQLIRRNEELRLLYDKIQLQQNILEKGALDYSSKVNDIVDAREKLMELRLRCRLALVRLRFIERLKKKELKVNRLLTEERARVRALTEELSKPVNVHRWRRLEGSQPALLDEIAKVQMLQKKLIAKCDECVRKSSEFKKKEAEYTQLRCRLARMPGPEAADDLALYCENIEKRKAQITTMKNDLHGVELHTEVLTEEVRQLNEELWEVKNKFMKTKTQHDLLLRERNVMQRTWGVLAPAAHAAMYQKAILNLPARAKTAPIETSETNSSFPSPLMTRISQGNLGVSRKALMRTEEDLLHTLTSGTNRANYPLSKPNGLKVIAGGGFSFTR